MKWILSKGLLILSLSIGCLAQVERLADPPLTRGCSITYRPPAGWDISGRLLWFSPTGIIPRQMEFDRAKGATIALEFRGKDESQGLKSDALRDARLRAEGAAIVTFHERQGRPVKAPGPELTLEYTEQYGTISRTTYRRACDGTLGIALRYGKAQSPDLKAKWNKVHAEILKSIREARIPNR